MASYRIGIGSFNLKDGNIGIGTETTGFGNLKVEGTIKTTDLDVGVSTFTRYAGLEGEETKFDKDVSLSGEYSTTGDIVVEPGGTLTVGLGSTACIGSVECISVKHHFSVPVGDTAGRNKSSGYTEGTVRYNKDLGTMEFYNGDEWRQFTYISDIQNSSSSRGRGVIGAGYISAPSTVYYSDLQYFNIASGGQSQYFGDVLSTGGGRSGSSMSSSTRGIFATGRSPSPSGHNTIEYITIASAGDATDFGDASQQCWNGSGCSTSTRGVFNLAFVGGSPVYNNVIEYVEIATLGDSKDFGDLTSVNSGWSASITSSTRGFWGAFYPRSDGTIDVVNIASKGNATLFGGAGSLLTDYGSNACSNSIRGIYAGGFGAYGGGGGGYTREIQSVTMSSEGSVVDFGNLSEPSYAGMAVASPVRACIVSGLNGSQGPTAYLTTIQDIAFSSGGTTSNFGDISTARRNFRGLSDSHGGLGGY